MPEAIRTEAPEGDVGGARSALDARGQTGSRDLIPTPALVCDLVLLRENVTVMARSVAGDGLRLRPHAKSHKSAFIAVLQLEHGAAGIACAKVAEAEVLVDRLSGSARGEPVDVLITSPLGGLASRGPGGRLGESLRGWPSWSTGPTEWWSWPTQQIGPEPRSPSSVTSTWVSAVRGWPDPRTRSRSRARSTAIHTSASEACRAMRVTSSTPLRDPFDTPAHASRASDSPGSRTRSPRRDTRYRSGPAAGRGPPAWRPSSERSTRSRQGATSSWTASTATHSGPIRKGASHRASPSRRR